MKTFKKVFLILLCVIFLAVVGFFVYMYTAFPKVQAAPDLKVDMSPEKIQRGEYLFNHVMACVDCHSGRNFDEFCYPFIPGTVGQGGFKFGPPEMPDFPGTIYSANITPAALGSWTDGEIFRALTEGVSKDGRALFPMMPYLNYGQLDKEDIYAVIAYVRTLKPIENKVPEASLNFPMNLIVRTIPTKNDLKPMPNKSNIIDYGKYLVTAASCMDCHTPAEKGEYDMSKFFAGGMEFNIIGGTVRTANITPDNETGIGTWSKQFFIDKFKMYDPHIYTPINVKPGEFNTVMPWNLYGGMTTEDIGAIYDYLRTIPPVKNTVVKFTPAPPPGK
jgi:hypothetical protein